jgi:hypothetical protein
MPSAIIFPMCHPACTWQWATPHPSIFKCSFTDRPLSLVIYNINLPAIPQTCQASVPSHLLILPCLCSSLSFVWVQMAFISDVLLNHSSTLILLSSKVFLCHTSYFLTLGLSVLFDSHISNTCIIPSSQLV